MASILFTDADGTWKLHNGKPFPADRFQSWTPDSTPFGDSSPRQSDGAITMLRLRDDFGVSFDLPLIPSIRSSNLILQPENFGTSWSLFNTPTRSAAAHTASGVTLDLLGDDTAAAIEYYYQAVTFTADGSKAVSAFLKRGTSPATSGSAILVDDVTAPITRMSATIVFSSAGVPTVTLSGSATYIGFEQQVDGVYRFLFSVASIVAANTNRVGIVPAITSAETGNVYAGGVQAENATVPTPYLYNTTAARSGVSMHEIADRLRYHLLNGGTCSVYTSDAAGSSYATCSLKPGTVPQLQLSDRRTLEYTLSLQLLNTAGSPARMLARYAEQ